MSYSGNVLYNSVKQGMTLVEKMKKFKSKYRSSLKYNPRSDEYLPFKGPYFKSRINGFILGVERLDQFDYVVFTMEGKLANVFYRSQIEKPSEQNPRGVWRTENCLVEHEIEKADKDTSSQVFKKKKPTQISTQRMKLVSLFKP